MDGGVELDCAYERDRLSWWEVAGYGCEEVGRVNADGDEDVEGCDFGYGNRDKTAVGIVDKQVAS